MAPNETVTLKLDVDYTGGPEMARARSDLAAYAAQARKLDQVSSRTSNSSRSRIDSQVKDHDRLTRAVDGSSNSLRRHNKEHDGLRKVMKGTLDAFGKFTSLIFKGFLVSLGATSLALIGIKAAMVAGRFAVKAYQASLAGLAAGAATVAAGLYTLAAAQREYAAAVAQVRYQPAASGGRRGAADAALRSLTGNQALAIAGNENLTATFSAISKQTEVTPEIVKALEGMGDFVAATGDFKNLATGGEFIASLVKAKSLTGDVVTSAEKLGPEFSDAMKKLQSEGKTSVTDVLQALSSGAAATSVGLNGALKSVNMTLIGSFKSQFQLLRDLAADLGMNFLQPATNSVNVIGETIRSTMVRSAYAVNAFAKGSLFNSLNSGVEKLATWSIKLIEDYLPKTEGFFSRIREWGRAIAGWFQSAIEFMKPLERAGEILIKFLMIPLEAIFSGFGNGLQNFSDLVKDNREDLMRFGDGLGRFISAVGKLFGTLKESFMQALPTLTAIADVFTSIVKALTGITKGFNAVGLGILPLLGFAAGGSLLKKGTKSKFFKGGSAINRRLGPGGAPMPGGGMQSVGTMTVTAGVVNLYQGAGPIGGGRPPTGGGGLVDQYGRPIGGGMPPVITPGTPGAPGPSGKIPFGQRFRGGLSRMGTGVKNFATGPYAPMAAGGLLMLGGNAAGAAIGGDTGQEVSTMATSIGMGAMTGAMFGPWGAAAGAVVGGIAGAVQINAQRNAKAEEAAEAIVESYDSNIQRTISRGNINRMMRTRDSLYLRQLQAYEEGDFRLGRKLGEQIDKFGPEGEYGRQIVRAEKQTARLSLITGKSTEEIKKLAKTMDVDLTGNMKDFKKLIEELLGAPTFGTNKEKGAASRDIFQQGLDRIFGRNIETAETRQAVNEAGRTFRNQLATGTVGEAGFDQYATAVGAYEFAVSGEDMIQATINMAKKLNTLDPQGLGRQFTEGYQLYGMEEQFRSSGSQAKLDQFFADQMKSQIASVAGSMALNAEKTGIENIDTARLTEQLNTSFADEIAAGDWDSAFEQLKTLRDSILTGAEQVAPLYGVESLGLSGITRSEQELNKLGISVSNIVDPTNRVATAMSEAEKKLSQIGVKGSLSGTIIVNGKVVTGEMKAAGDIYSSGALAGTGRGANNGGADGDPDTPEDTATFRRNRTGDTTSSKFANTLRSHRRISRMLGGKRNITSGVRFDNLGSLSSDHTVGAALDLVGDNLGAYAEMVRADGGFAEFHGAAGNRHLHVVPGTGAMGDMANPVAGQVGSGGNTENHTYYLTVNPTPNASADEIAQAVMTKIERTQRSNRERM